MFLKRNYLCCWESRAYLPLGVPIMVNPRDGFDAIEFKAIYNKLLKGKG
jgi:hypothetical protein